MVESKVENIGQKALLGEQLLASGAVTESQLTIATAKADRRTAGRDPAQIGIPVFRRTVPGTGQSVRSRAH